MGRVGVQGILTQREYKADSPGAGNVLFLDLGTGHIVCSICESSLNCTFMMHAFFGTYINLTVHHRKQVNKQDIAILWNQKELIKNVISICIELEKGL